MLRLTLVGCCLTGLTGCGAETHPPQGTASTLSNRVSDQASVSRSDGEELAGASARPETAVQPSSDDQRNFVLKSKNGTQSPRPKYPVVQTSFQQLLAEFDEPQDNRSGETIDPALNVSARMEQAATDDGNSDSDTQTNSEVASESMDLGAATVKVANRNAVELTEKNGWSGIPDYLQGASVYSELGTANKSVEFTVEKGGVVIVVASWTYDGNRSGGWYEDRSTKESLQRDGWAPLGTIVHTLKGADHEYTILRRIAKAGEKFQFHTRKYNPPFVVALNATQAGLAIAQKPAFVATPNWESSVLPTIPENIALSPDGTIIAILGKRGKIYLRDVTTQEELATFEAHTGWGRLSFSPDGKLLASGGAGDRQIKLWDVVAKKHLATQTHEPGIQGLAFSPDGKTVATSSGSIYRSGGSVKLWSVPDLNELATLNRPQTALIVDVSFSPDGKQLAAVRNLHEELGHPSQVDIWDLKTQQVVTELPIKFGQGCRAVFSPDSKLLAISERNGPNRLRVSYRIRLVHLETGKQQASLSGHTSVIAGLAFSPDGKHLVSTSMDRTLRVWNVPGTQQAAGTEQPPEQNVLSLPGSRTSDVVFSRDGRFFATAGSRAAVWSLDVAANAKTETASNVLSLRTSDGVGGLQLRPDGEKLGVIFLSGTEEIWEFDTRSWKGEDITSQFGEPRPRIRKPRGTWIPHVVALSPDLKLAVSGYAGVAAGLPAHDSVEVREIQTGRVVRKFDESEQLISLAFSADGTLFATGHPGKVVKIWHIPSAQLWATAETEAEPSHLAFSASGKRLAAGAKRHPKGLIAIWDLTDREQPTGKPLTAPKTLAQGATIYSLAFSPDGKTLACSSYAPWGRADQRSNSDNTQLWDVDTGESTMTIAGHDAVFSPDGKLLATVGHNSEAATATLWNLETGKPVHKLRNGHLRQIQHLAFFPGGKFLVTGGGGGLVTVWNTETGMASREPTQSKP